MANEGIGGPKIAVSGINGVKSITSNSQTTSQSTVETTNPDMKITNFKAEITNPKAEITNLNVKITNPNNQQLTWLSTIKYTPGEPDGWLELSDHNGPLKAHETSNPPIKVNVNKANLTRGKTYTAQVVFSWHPLPPTGHGDTLEVTVTV